MYMISKNNIQLYHLRLSKVGRKEVKKNSWTCFNLSKDDIKNQLVIQKEKIFNEGT